MFVLKNGGKGCKKDLKFLGIPTDEKIASSPRIYVVNLKGIKERCSPLHVQFYVFSLPVVHCEQRHFFLVSKSAKTDENLACGWIMM